MELFGTARITAPKDTVAKYEVQLEIFKPLGKKSWHIRIALKGIDRDTREFHRKEEAQPVSTKQMVKLKQAAATRARKYAAAQLDARLPSNIGMSAIEWTPR